MHSQTITDPWPFKGRIFQSFRGLTGIMMIWIMGIQPPVRSAEPGGISFLDNGVTAHRGNSQEHPENTLAAFRSGIEVGADWLELDILSTRDGRLVVIHDTTTDRTTGVSMRVLDTTLEPLRKLDAATGFRRQHGLSLSECPPQPIPLLEEVLREVMKQGKTRVSIQPKSDCVDETLRLIRSLGAERWVGFNDGNLSYMARVKELAPAIPVFWDRGPDTDLKSDLRVAKAHGFEALVLHHRGVTAEKVQAIRAAGLEVGAWTVNDPQEMDRLIGLGVQRLYTDAPRMLLQRKLPRPTLP